MCRTITPKSEQILCSRCNQVANPTDGWEHGWCIYGNINLGFHSRINDALAGKFISKIPKSNVIKDFGFQEITLEWGNGFKYDTTGKYRLCEPCQRELLNLIGKFFGLDTGG